MQIRIRFNADPDPAFFPNAEPDPDPGFFDTLDRGKKFFKTFFKFFFQFSIFLSIVMVSNMM